MELILDPNAPEGMGDAECRKLAASWWDKKGRLLMAKVANYSQAPDRVKMSPNAPMIRIKGDRTPDMTDGIMLPRAWDTLTLQEQGLIIDAWKKGHLDEHGQPILNNAD